MLLLRILLIVPYGIETRNNTALGIAFYLLIVPYGIETWVSDKEMTGFNAFNRTLWN